VDNEVRYFISNLVGLVPSGEMVEPIVTFTHHEQRRDLYIKNCFYFWTLNILFYVLVFVVLFIASEIVDRNRICFPI
jgi:hypothetical protein